MARLIGNRPAPLEPIFRLFDGRDLLAVTILGDDEMKGFAPAYFYHPTHMGTPRGLCNLRARFFQGEGLAKCPSQNRVCSAFKYGPLPSSSALDSAPMTSDPRRNPDVTYDP